jgi:DNA-directed RNA polymerase specialized sigma24 family protein
MAKPTDTETKALIAEAVNAGLQAGRAHASSAAEDAFRATERRLYALPILERKAKDDREMLEETLSHGLRGRSAVRFRRSGYRVSPEEMLEAVIGDLKATIAADEHEIAAVRRALCDIVDDPYYMAVEGKYIKGLPDEAIAEQMPCDSTTVWRNRRRLVQRLAILLYGAAAI